MSDIKYFNIIYNIENGRKSNVKIDFMTACKEMKSLGYWATPSDPGYSWVAVM